MEENEKLRISKNAAKSFCNNGESWEEWWGEAWLSMNGDNLNNVNQINSRMAYARYDESLTGNYVVDDVPDMHKNPAEQIAEKDLILYLEENLSEKSRKILDLLLEGATMKEVGQAFGKTSAWANAEWKRIRKVLAEKTKQNDELREIVNY